VILASCQFIFASIPDVKNDGSPFNTNNPVEDRNRFRPADFKLTDSLLATLQLDYEYIKPRYTKLKPADNVADTILRTSDANIELLKKNTLSTLKSKGENNFITRNLFSLIIKGNELPKGQMGVNSSLYFAPFAGKQIRNIRIQQLDVFGPSLQDTSRQATGWVERAGNNIHLKTTEQTIRKLLLFNSGETVNPQLMADNEKVIRDLPYIQDVAIILSYPEKESDQVDVLVILKERFEFGVSGSLSSNSSELEITDQNMFGLGHQFSAEMVYFQTEKPVLVVVSTM